MVLTGLSEEKHKVVVPEGERSRFVSCSDDAEIKAMLTEITAAASLEYQ